ncbi:MAG: ATP-binding protein, partial [Muribaculaceae bacterium]|nr:ATP-binding protein [Muribaculaceae bacterium]
VDEYDKPLLDIEDDRRLFENNQRMLKSFFGNLKTMDRYIRFVFITGVARFSKVSIFSDLNNLKDISIEDAYADICGWTESELIETFRSGIEDLSKKRKEDFESTLSALRDYYDGYLFTEEGSRLYNPFSVLNALDKKRIAPYWFQTGTPTFLAKRIKARGTYPPDINGKMCTREELISAGLDDRNPIPLMFQTGYLTIGSYQEELNLYELRFPNSEVEFGFYQQLLPIYVPEVKDPDSPFNFTNFKIDLYEGHPFEFMQRLKILLKDLPGEDHKESSYRAITYLLAVLCGTKAIAEHHGYKGRSDIEVATSSYLYIFEFKYNKSVGEAMEQIHSRDYAGRYAIDRRTVYLIGANFNEDKDNRGLEFEIEKLN